MNPTVVAVVGAVVAVVSMSCRSLLQQTQLMMLVSRYCEPHQKWNRTFKKSKISVLILFPLKTE